MATGTGMAQHATARVSEETVLLRVIAEAARNPKAVDQFLERYENAKIEAQEREVAASRRIAEAQEAEIDARQAKAAAEEVIAKATAESAAVADTARQFEKKITERSAALDTREQDLQQQRELLDEQREKSERLAAKVNTDRASLEGIARQQAERSAQLDQRAAELEKAKAEFKTQVEAASGVLRGIKVPT